MSLRIRRGGGSGQTPPPTGLIYGPIQGAAAVRSQAGPQTVTHPGTGISFNSSASLQAAINNVANPVGSTFVCSVNNPVWNSSVNTFNRAPTIVFPGAPGQVVINGNGAEITAIQAGNGATVKGGHITNFGTAINSNGVTMQDDVLLEDIMISDCRNVGVAFQGHRAIIRRLELFDNGLQGCGAGISGPGQADDCIIENCDVYGNNTRQQNPGIEGGAWKFLNQGRGIARNNWVHDNIGFGAWWDTNCYDWIIENNVCEDNYFAGLFLEANYGLVARNNLVMNNGKNTSVGGLPAGNDSQCQVRLSDNSANRTNPDGLVTPIQFTRNLVDNDEFPNGSQSTLLVLWDHTDSSVRHVSNNHIFENQFWIRNSLTQRIWCRDEDTQGLPATTNFQLWNLNNTFSDNEYRVQSPGVSYWRWGTGTETGSAKNYAQWQTFHPQDNNPLITI